MSCGHAAQQRHLYYKGVVTPQVRHCQERLKAPHLVTNNAVSGQKLEEGYSAPPRGHPLLVLQWYFGNKYKGNNIPKRYMIEITLRRAISSTQSARPIIQPVDPFISVESLYSTRVFAVCLIKILVWWEKPDFQMVTLLIQ